MQARENQNLKVPTVQFPVAEKWKGTVNMATKEPPSELRRMTRLNTSARTSISFAIHPDSSSM